MSPYPWLDVRARSAPRLETVSAVLGGGCSCGTVRYRLASEPMFVHCCHCTNCQRQTGTAFVINLLIEADRVEVTAGEPRAVPLPRDDGSEQVVFRCPACQVALFSEYSRPEVRFVRAGTLDDASWVELPASVPAVDLYYDSKSLWPAPSLERLRAVMRPPG